MSALIVMHIKRISPLLKECQAGMLQETKIKPKNTIAPFAVPKADPLNPRMIMDFKPSQN